MSGGRLLQVFRSSRREGHYLFVDLAEGLERVPEALLLQFGRPEPALRLNLIRERRLAAADAGAVLDAIAEKGFYLQLPPQAVGPTEPPPVGEGVYAPQVRRPQATGPTEPLPNQGDRPGSGTDDPEKPGGDREA